MFYCQLCEVNSCYTSRFCPRCRALKHLILLHNEDNGNNRVFEVVNSVLLRTEQDKQNNKIKFELKKEIEKRNDIIKKN